MRRSLLAAAGVTAVLAAGPGAALAEGASVFTATSRVSGEVASRDGPVLDSFSLDSDTAGRPDLSGSARDPGGTANSDADVTFQTTTVVGGEQLSARGSTSARSGDPVREASSTSGFVAEFTLTEPARYSATGSLSGSSPPGHCCAGGSARLTDDNGDTVFVASINSGEPSEDVASSGTLPPGDYRYQLEASVGFGFGAAASNIAGTAAFDVSFTLTFPGADADGDALPDEWETNGVDTDGDGTIDLNLPAMGADPLHKDIFVELDFMPPHRPTLEAGRLITAAFANAPVANPDGTPGIALHLDNGADSVMNPRTGATWGGLSRQNALVHQDVLGSFGPTGEYDWGAFDDLKSTSLEPRRAGVFHYVISGHGHDGRGSGIARDIPSSDFLITLGAGCAALNGGVECTLDPRAQAGTLMHELGHNLGLRHGGADDLVRKPNYLSVMNYAFQLTGLMRSNLTFFLDYSRFTIPLDERALNEGSGFGITSGPAALLNTAGRCPSGAQRVWALAAGFTDFDCDGANGGVVSSDVTGDGNETLLPGFTDWPALVYAGGAIGDAGVALPATTERIEPPLEELLASKKALEDYVAARQAGTDPPGGPGPSATTPPGTTSGPLEMTSLTVRPARLRPARRGSSIGTRGGAVVTYVLTRPARVRFTVLRLAEGRRRAGRCRPPKQAPRGRRCTRRIAVRGSFTHSGTDGVNTFRFTGRLAGKALAPGGYRLIAEPIAADGSRGTPRGAAFKIRR